MSNPDNYAIFKAPNKDSALGATSTRLHLRKRSAANWSLPVPDASFDSGDTAWEESLIAAVKRSGESVEFLPAHLERLRAEANRVLHPVAKTHRFD